MSDADVSLLARIAVGFALAYIFGFERQLRGSPAGNRTFAVVGAASTAIAAVAGRSSPQAVAGIVTGIGFIGGAAVFRGGSGTIKGLTSAATIFAVAGIGIVVGFGHLALGAITAALLLLTLELENIPFLRWLDAGAYISRFSSQGSSEGRVQPPKQDLEGQE